MVMDGALLRATAALVAKVDLTTYLANQCVNAIPFAQLDLGQLLCELRSLHDRLQQLQSDAIPPALQASSLNVIDGCSEICKRVGDILAGCGVDGGPLKSWALVNARTEIRKLKPALERGRRTMDIVDKALDPNYDEVLTDINGLREALIEGTPPLLIHASIVSCLDAVEIYISKTPVASVKPENRPSPNSPTSPSIQEMIMSFRQSSLQDWEARDSANRAMEQSYNSNHPNDPRSSHSPHSPQRTIDSEDRLDKAPKSGRYSFKNEDLRPPPLRLNQRNLVGNKRPAPIYSLFPPISPPPVKALPPVPPVRSSKRPASTPAHPLPARAPSFPPRNPIRTKDRAYSDQTHDSKFSSLSTAADRFSGFSQGSSAPSRSSFHANQEARSFSNLKTDTLSEYSAIELEIVPLRRLENNDKEAFHGGVYSIYALNNSTTLASRQGKFHIRVWDLLSSTLLTTLKVSFYVQAQPRSRDYFIRSHAILSETLNLIGITSGFGQTLEIWNWAKRKKLQTINDALRWAAVRSDVYESRCHPLATYSEDDNAIKLYPVSPAAKKPFGKPRVIDLQKAGLPHLPKLPELAFSATGPLLIAAAGPRPPRPGNPPPAHAALLMAWQLDDGDQRIHNQPYKFCETTNHPEIENSLPLHLETYGSVAVSIWEPAKFRTIGRPGLWQVEPVTVTERVVLVWDFSGPVDRTTTYSIPAVLACISPDCRFIAYCDPGGRDGADADGALVVLDATRKGQELWRLDASGRKSNMTDCMSGGSSRWLRKSSDTRRSGQRSTKSSKSSMIDGEEGLKILTGNLKEVTELAFSSDGSRLLVGDGDGGIGVYEFRIEGLHMTHSQE